MAVFGITGRMGQSLLEALRGSGEHALCGAIVAGTSPYLGQDAALSGAPVGVPILADIGTALKEAEVALDFSVAAVVAGHARRCAVAGVPLLVGATGLDEATHEALRKAAVRIPVLVAPNTSVGVGVLAHLAAVAAAALPGEFDIEIFEAHHRDKRDAPSGTALRLGEAVAGARGTTLAEAAVTDRAGVRRQGSIGLSSSRGGDIVGEHTVTYAGLGERLELTHRATDRRIFARGALRGAAWLVGRPPGLYSMQQVLGL